jgi:hypothetical protein
MTYAEEISANSFDERHVTQGRVAANSPICGTNLELFLGDFKDFSEQIEMW